jgi:hypothetical protein
MSAEIGNNSLIDTWGSGGAVTEPALGKIQTGWIVSEYPPAETMNWIHNTLGQQVNYAIRSGVSAWSADTPYVAGDVVTRTGDMWMALSGNTNSAPTSVNANWRRIPRLENIATVGRTGDYSDLLNTPASFPPASHTHTLAAITDLAPLSQGQWNTGTSTTEAVISPAKLAAVVATLTAIIIPVGSVFHLATSTVPAGFLKANNQEVSRTTYAALWDALGQPNTGNGATTFNVPDLRGEFVRGWDDGRGVDSGRAIRSSQGDAIRDIQGTFAMEPRGLAPHLTGAFEFGPFVSAETSAPGGQTDRIVRFKASRVVPTALENRPRNVALMAVIKF